MEAHGERPGSNVQVVTVRLPREGTVDDVLTLLAKEPGTDFGTKKLRLMEILFNKIYKVRRSFIHRPSTFLQSANRTCGLSAPYDMFFCLLFSSLFLGVQMLLDVGVCLSALLPSCACPWNMCGSHVDGNSASADRLS